MEPSPTNSTAAEKGMQQTQIPDLDELILGIISLGRLIPSLSQTEKNLALQTTIRPTLSHSLLVEREEEPNPPAEHDHDMSLYRACESN